MNNQVFTKGAVVGLIVNGAGFVLALALQLVLARNLTVSSFGAYQWLMSIFSIALVCMVAGVDGVFLQQLPRVLAKDKASAEEIVSWGRRRVFRGALVVALALVGWSFSFDPLGSQVQLTIILGAIMTVVWAQNQIRQAILRGAFSIAKARVPDVILRPIVILILVLIAGFVAGSSGLPLPIVFLIHLIAVVVTFIVGNRFVKEILKSRTGFEPRSESIKLGHRFFGMSRAASILFLVNIAAIAISEVDKILIGNLLSFDIVAGFGVASRLAVLTLFTQDAIASIAAPMLASAHHRGGAGGLLQESRRTTQWSILTTLPIFFVLIFCGEWILSCFGGSYQESYEPMILMSSVFMLSLFFGPGGYILTMAGEQAACLKGLVFSLVSQVGLLLPAIASGNVSLIALASASGVLLKSILMFLFVKHRLKFNCSLFSSNLP